VLRLTCKSSSLRDPRGVGARFMVAADNTPLRLRPLTSPANPTKLRVAPGLTECAHDWSAIDDGQTCSTNFSNVTHNAFEVPTNITVGGARGAYAWPDAGSGSRREFDVAHSALGDVAADGGGRGYSIPGARRSARSSSSPAARGRATRWECRVSVVSRARSSHCRAQRSVTFGSRAAHLQTWTAPGNTGRRGPPQRRP
jgi:hypothetical protein